MWNSETKWRWLTADKMPAILGPFESSLRGRRSLGTEDQATKMILHHSCSGASHGYGVKKERLRLEKERERRNCSLPPDINGHVADVPDILLDSLSSHSGSGHTWLDSEREEGNIVVIAVLRIILDMMPRQCWQTFIIKPCFTFVTDLHIEQLMTCNPSFANFAVSSSEDCFVWTTLFTTSLQLN